MSNTRYCARHLWLVPGAVVVFAPLLREIMPAGLAVAGLSTPQFLAIELCLALAAVFARHAARPAARARAGIVAALAAAGCVVCAAWVAWFLGTDRAVFLPQSGDVVGVAGFLIAAVLAAGLLSGGLQIAFVAALAVGLGGLAPYIGAGDGARQVPLASYANYLVYGADGLLGRALDIMVSPVMAFVVFGAAFEASGGGRALSSVAMKLAERSRAGAIKACILASGMFGAVSGTAISNVMTTGAFSIPSMRRIGVRNETAAGIEAAASTSGQIMPPVMGAAAFLLADFVGESYATVAFASLLPALGVYLALFRQADLVAFDETGPPPAATPVPRAAALHLVGPGLLVVLLAGVEMQSDRAAMLGAAGCLGVSLLLSGWRETGVQLRAGVERLIGTGLHLVVIAGAMGLVLGVLNATGVAVAAAVTLADLGQHSLVLALLVAGAAAFVLGMGMATVGVYVLAGAMLAPGLVEAGVPPLAAHFFVLYCGILSMLTPPVALASLAASALAKADFTRTARAGLRFGWILFVMPFVVVAQPGLVLLGGWEAVLQGVLVMLAFILAATAPGLTPGLRTGLAGLALGAVFWSGPGWIAQAVAVAIGGGVVLRSRLRPA